MFKIIIQIIILIYLIATFYHSSQLQKYNTNGFIIDTDDEKTMFRNLEILNPVLLKSNIDYHTKEKLISSFKDKQLFQKITVQNDFDINQLPKPEFHFPIQKSISVLDQSIPLKKCIHNYNIICLLEGECTFYLFNPKHTDEIQNKENHQIRKWGHKKKVQKGEILLIPPFWSYLQEVQQKTIQYHIDIDNYFTFIVNFLKEFYFGYVDG